MNNRTIILHMLLFSLFSMVRANDSSSINDFLTVLKIRESKLITVLDSIIDFEAQCDYYSPNLVYSIGLKCEGKDTINIQIGSLGYDIMKSKAHLGCFVYRGHLFVVSGRYLDKVLFYKTDERKIIEYYKSKGNIGNNQRNKIILDIIEDDSFSFWIYKYINGNMVFLNRYDTYCK